MEAKGRIGARAQRTSSVVAARRNGGSAKARSAARVRPLHEGDRETASPRRIAILDRDSGFLLVLAKRMERLGWKHQVLPARPTTKTIASLQADALIVNLTMLGAKRWKWLARVCEQRPDVRVIVCTGASSVAERVCGLRLGADDWLSKPCHPEELIARVEAITSHRQRAEERDLEPLSVGEIEIRPDQFQAFLGGESLRLTRREYQLIEMLARAGGEVLPRESIYECLWGGEMIRNDRSVDVFVHKLRRKLERASPDWRYVHTHFGVGYKLVAQLVDGASVHELQVAEEPALAALAA